MPESASDHGGFSVRFLGPGKGVSGEEPSQWEPKCSGKVWFDQDAVHIDGKWKVSVVWNVLTFGGFAQPLIYKLFARDRSVVIAFRDLERVEVSKPRGWVIGVFPKRKDADTVEVHRMLWWSPGSSKRSADEEIELLRATVPGNLLTDKTPVAPGSKGKP